jgi:hypothetical protein
MLDTNQVQQVAAVAAEAKAQLTPWLPAIAVGAAWLGREIRNLNAWLFNAGEFVMQRGGVLMILVKLIWDPAAATNLPTPGEGTRPTENTNPTNAVK